MELLFFYIFSTLSVLTALMVIIFKNPVHSVVAMITCFFQIAGIFVLLRSPFLAGAQLFVYVGAIMIFFVFAVFLLDFRKSMAKTRFGKWAGPGLVAAVLIFIEVVALISKGSFAGMAGQDANISSLLSMGQSTKAIGTVMFTKYLLPFEIISVVLLVGFVGAVVLTVQERKED
jgi:NADH-quinone oxidoreductase subunit J